MLRENKSKIIMALILVAVIAAGIFVKIYFIDAVNVSISEYYESITWNMTEQEAKNRLQTNGVTIIRDDGFVVFKIENYGGVEGANGRGILMSDENDEVYGVMCIFEAEGEDGIGEKMLSKLTKACEKELDETFDKKVDKEEMLEILREEQPDVEEGILPGKINDAWLGSSTYIGMIYHESDKLTITYENIDSEYGKYLLSVDR